MTIDAPRRRVRHSTSARSFAWIHEPDASSSLASAGEMSFTTRPRASSAAAATATAPAPAPSAQAPKRQRGGEPFVRRVALAAASCCALVSSPRTARRTRTTRRLDRRHAPAETPRATRSTCARAPPLDSRSLDTHFRSRSPMGSRAHASTAGGVKTLRTLRHIILRAGRLTYPKGKLALTMSGNRKVRDGAREFFVPMRNSCRLLPP